MQKKYVFDQTPRVEGLPHTAPKYDAVTAPVTAPIPALCVASKTKCSCYSQQATVMVVADVTCRSIVDRGYFVDFEDKPNRAQSQQVLNRPDGLPLSRANTREVEPRMIADRPIVAAAATAENLEDGYGELGKRGAGVRRRVAEHNALTN
jgi:zona occludens toxin